MGSSPTSGTFFLFIFFALLQVEQGTLNLNVSYHQAHVEVTDEEHGQECVHLSLRLLRVAGLKVSIECRKTVVLASPNLFVGRSQSSCRQWLPAGRDRLVLWCQHLP